MSKLHWLIPVLTVLALSTHSALGSTSTGGPEAGSDHLIGGLVIAANLNVVMIEGNDGDPLDAWISYGPTQTKSSTSTPYFPAENVYCSFFVFVSGGTQPYDIDWQGASGPDYDEHELIERMPTEDVTGDSIQIRQWVEVTDAASNFAEDEYYFVVSPYYDVAPECNVQ